MIDICFLSIYVNPISVQVYCTEISLLECIIIIIIYYYHAYVFIDYYY
jgi:hypothetical protein